MQQSKDESEDAWENDGTLNRNLRLVEAVEVVDGTNVLGETFLRESQPQTRQRVVVTSRERYDLQRGVDIRISPRVQWWNFGTPLHCKVSNVASSRLSLPTRSHVATAFGVNNFDVARIRPVR